MATTKLLTAEDLWDLEDNAGRYDLIRGELIRVAPAGAPHGKLALRIGSILLAHIDAMQLGDAYGAETGFILARDPDVLLAPDFAYVRSDRLPPQDEQKGFMEVAPDLVVEIVSPSDLSRHVHAKVMEYLGGGVKLVWVIHPDQKEVTVFTPDRRARVLTLGEELDGGDVLPGFRFPLADIFR